MSPEGEVPVEADTAVTELPGTVPGAPPPAQREAPGSAPVVDAVSPIDPGPVDTGPVDTGPVDTVRPDVDPGPVDTVRPDVDPAQRVLDVANEAIPATPESGVAPVGSIPAAELRRAWARVQALNWRLFLVRMLASGLAVVLTVMLLPGLGFTGWQWGQFLRIAVVFGLLNAVVKPALQFLALRFIFSTYGVVVVLINAVLLVLLGWLLPDTFEVYRPSALFFGGLVVGILGMVLETLLGANPPILDRDYRERNGLP